MRFQLPEGCAGVSHAGRQLPVAGDGTVEADPAAGGDLAAHGLAPAARQPADPPQAAAARAERRAR